MMRFLSATAICLVLSASVIADQKNASKHKNATHAVVEGHDGAVTTLDAHVSWTTHDVAVIRRYYSPKYRNLPPGLRKKYQRTGQLPPGWQKKMEPFPATLERECEPLPAGYRRGVFDAHAVIYNARGTIIDLAVLF